MKDNSQDESVLALKELKRQSEKMRDTMGDEAMDRALASSSEVQDLERAIENLCNGRITVEQAQHELDHAEELIGQAAREADDPELVTSVEAQNEARARQLPLAAELLVSDAVRSAAQGISKEQWIAEVLRGHERDEAAQLGCLRHIVTLWNDGPWPWPRTNVQ